MSFVFYSDACNDGFCCSIGLRGVCCFNSICSCTLHPCHRHPLPDPALRVRRRGWFELPATQITDEVKRDLRLLHLRSALDPKRFYKGFDQTKFPKHFQLGTVVEGAADFYSGPALLLP